MRCCESKDSLRSHTRISISLFSCSLKHFWKVFVFGSTVSHCSVSASLLVAVLGLLNAVASLEERRHLRAVMVAISVAPRRVGSS